MDNDSLWEHIGPERGNGEYIKAQM